jgi:hypothetical protein
MRRHASLACRILATSVVVASFAVRATAQQPQPGNAAPADPVAADVLAAEKRGLHIAQSIESAPGATSPYALPAPEVTLQTTKSGTDATAVIGVANPVLGARVTVRTPIGKEDDAEATPVSLAGLGNQASIDFAVIRRRMFRQSGPKRDINQLRLDFCKQHGVAEEKCSDQAFSAAERNTFLTYGIFPHPTVATAHVQVGGKSFDFVETGASTKQTEKFTSIAAGASYGWLFLDHSSVFAVSVDFSRDYSGSKDSTLLCTPVATDVPGTERCDTRTIGRPTASKKVTTALDFRKVFTRVERLHAKPGEGDKPPTPPPFPSRSVPVVGMSVQLRVQAIQDEKTVWGVDVPVYFLQKKPEENTSVALNGGATGGWNSKDGFVARVFIGTSFSLLGKELGR